MHAQQCADVEILLRNSMQQQLLRQLLNLRAFSSFLRVLIARHPQFLKPDARCYRRRLSFSLSNSS
jgi:hypothetical protein